MGYVKPTEIYKYYALADGMVFPSLNGQSSYVMLKAMKYRVALVVTDIPAFEMLKEGHSCLKSPLVGKRVNMENLAENMIILALDSSFGERIAQNAFDLFKDNYSSEKMFFGTYESLFT